MIDIKVLRAMASAGATVEMILAAVEAAQSEHQKKVDERRTKDAARQQRNRQSRRSSVRNGHTESRGPSDGPVDRVTSYDDVCDMPGIYTSPSIEVSKEESKKVYAEKRKTRLPEGFTLSEASFLFAEKKGWGSARIQSEFNRFCDHARANGKRQIDWEATWRNWVTSPFQKLDQINGNHARTASDVLREMCEGTGRRESEDTGWLLPPDGCERS